MVLNHIRHRSTVVNECVKMTRISHEELKEFKYLSPPYRSPNIVSVIKSRRLKWSGHVARLEDCRSVFKILTGTPAGKRPLERSRGDNIRMDLKKNTRNWVYLT